jgi:hypothetical protein
MLHKYMIHLLLLGCIICFFPFSLVRADPLSPQQEALARTAIIGYLDYRDRFPFYSCQFQVLTLASKSPEDALQGKYIAVEPFVSECRLVVDGDQYLFQEKAPPVKPPSTPPKKGETVKSVSVVSVSKTELANGKLSLGYVPDGELMNLHQEHPSPKT